MDRGQEQTEAILKKIEKRITEEYAQAEEEIEATLADYFRRFKKKDETWQKWVEEGTKTAKEYEQWRIGQMAVGKTWQNQRDAIAKKLADVNAEANTIARSYVPDIYVTNYTYSLNQVGRQINVSSSFTQYSQEAINRLVLDDPEVAPPAGKKVQQQIAEGKAIKWNKHKLQSVMVQGIMQGESIPKLATRLATTVGDSDRKASIRNARTMATGVQNAGRIDCYKRAESKGVKMKQMWLATHDDRTRHSHRWLDGETQPVGGTFSNGCRFPADPQGAPAEIYNCRCTLRGVVDGLQRISGKYRDDSAMGASYDVWREGDSKASKITKQDEIAKAIKKDYISRYIGRSKKSDFDFMGQPQYFETDDGVIKGYKLDGYDKIYVKRYNDNVLKTAELVNSLMDEVEGLKDVSAIVISNKFEIAGYNHVDNSLHINEKLGDDNYTKQKITGYFAARNVKETLNHEMKHKQHWDKIKEKAKAAGIDELTMKKRMEYNVRKYVDNQRIMDYNYIIKNVSKNANSNYLNYDILNELIADQLVLADKDEVKDLTLLELIKEMLQ